MGRHLDESVDGGRIEDARSAVGEQDGGEAGPAVHDAERGRAQDLPRMFADTLLLCRTGSITLRWCRVESKGGDERCDFNGQVGEGCGIRGRRGQ